MTWRSSSVKQLIGGWNKMKEQEGLFTKTLGILAKSCLNSKLESTAIYWRNMFKIPLDYYGPFK